MKHESGGGSLSRNDLPVFWKERHFAIPLLTLGVLFALVQGGLGVFWYLPSGVVRSLQVLFVTSSFLLVLWGGLNLRMAPSQYRKMVFMLIGVNAWFAVMSAVFGGSRLLFYVESALFAVAFIVVIGDQRILISLLRVVFVGGTALIILNTVPLLHWGGIADLDPTTIPRLIDTGKDITHLDPLSFGIFGRTENVAAPGHFFGRLQGWSLEPQHWGYFVLLTLACGLLLAGWRVESGRRPGVGAFWMMAIVVYTFFLQSTSVFVTLVAWAGVTGAIWVLRALSVSRKSESVFLFLVMVLVPGLLIPFTLAMIPGIEFLFYTEDIFGEGRNWASRIGFLSMGSALFTIWWPTQVIDVPASHNLILEYYLRYGYFVLLPLLVFWYWFIIRWVTERSMLLTSALVLIGFVHFLLLPNAFFLPSGVLFFSVGIGMCRIVKPLQRDA